MIGLSRFTLVKLTAFLAENLNFLAFLVGFGLFSGALASYSLRLSALVAGAILMVVAAYPFMVKRGN